MEATPGLAASRPSHQQHQHKRHKTEHKHKKKGKKSKHKHKQGSQEIDMEQLGTNQTFCNKIFKKGSYMMFNGEGMVSVNMKLALCTTIMCNKSAIKITGV